MAPLANPPSRRRLSPPSTAPSARCNNKFVSPSSPPQKRNSGNSWDPLSGCYEGVTLSNPSVRPATLSSTQKGEQVQHPAPPPKERPPDPMVANIPTRGQGPKGNRGLLPSLLDFLPGSDRNSTGSSSPPSQAKKGHGIKLPPFLHFLDPGMGTTSPSNSPPSPTTPAPPPSGPPNPPSAPPPPVITDQPSKPEATPAPLPPVTSGKLDDNATPPPAQTTSAQATTTTSDGGAVTVSPTVTRSASVIEDEHGASFPTGEVSSSVLPAASSSRTINTNTIKSAFVYVTTVAESTSHTEDVPGPTESSHIENSTAVEPLITSPATLTTYSVITAPGQVSSTPSSVAAIPTTISQSPNSPTTAGATSSNSRTSAVISGVVVCTAIVLIAGSLLVLYWARRRRRRQASFQNADKHTYPTSGAAAFSPLSDSEIPGPMREISAVRGTSRPFNTVSPTDDSILPRTMIPRTAQESSLLLSAATFGSNSSHHSPGHTPNASDTSIQSTHEIPSAAHPYWGPVLQQARETLVSGSSVGQGPTGTIVSSADPYSLDSAASPSSRPVVVVQRLAALDPFADSEPNPFDDPTVPTKYLTVRPGTRLSLASGRVSPNSMLVHE